jgi:hypothetical protein
VDSKLRFDGSPSLRYAAPQRNGAKRSALKRSGAGESL